MDSLSKKNNKDEISSRKEYEVGDLFIYIGNGGIHYIRIKSILDGIIHHEYSNDGIEWNNYGSDSIERFRNRHDMTPINSIEELEELKKLYMANPNFLGDISEAVNEDEFALTTTKTKNDIQTMQDAIAEKKRKAGVVYAAMQMEWEAKKRHLQELSSKFASEIYKLQRVIDAIALYLGIDTEIVQLASGKTSKAPVSLRQLVLYMDEEFGDPRPNKSNGQHGLDFTCVEDFDKWVLEKGLNQLLPEPKGIVAIKPSRQNRRYSSDSWINSIINGENQMTYFLIRNGENVYRLFTGISCDEHLYPTLASMQKVLDMLEKEDDFHFDQTKEQVMDEEYIYKRNALIIQGLVDRTQIFQPLPECSLFKPETYDGAFDFVRDGELALSDGHLGWKEWKESINANIGVGSRILVLPPDYFSNSSVLVTRADYSRRFLRYYDKNSGSVPPLPGTGVYLIEDEIHGIYNGREYSNLIIRYNPKDTVTFTGWDFDPHTRKNRVSFKIYSSDAFVFNYDEVSLAEIDYYLNDRTARKHILDFIYGIWVLRDFLLKEKEKEFHFIELIANRLNVSIETVQEAVDWWKFKNKWKRYVSDDDAKALRMIEKRIKKQIAEN